MCDARNSRNDLVCRCEEVSEDEIIEAIEAGATTADAIKKLTRAGMGLCQGRTCRSLVARILAERLGCSVGDVVPFTYRPPVRPTSLGDLVKVTGSREGERSNENR